MIKISRNELRDAAQQGLLAPEQVGPLYDWLLHQQNPTTRFSLTNMLYYLGGFLAIGALSLFMNLGWEQFGGWGILGLSVLYAGVALGWAEVLRRRALELPAALCTVAVVVLVPLAIYGLQQAMGWWHEESHYRDYHSIISPQWLWMELGTLAAGLLMFARYRYPLLIMPLAFTLWYLTMDLADGIAGTDVSYQQRALLTMLLGGLILLGALLTDIYSNHRYDYAWWLYLVGVLSFWGGLTCQNSDSELARLGYCAVNLFMMWLGVVLQRRVFTLFGAFGVAFYIGHLVWSVFSDSWLFPILLTLIGMAVVYAGVLWQRNETGITARLQASLPLKIRNLLAQRHN